MDRIRVYTLPVLEAGRAVAWVQAAQSLAPVEDALDRLLAALVAGSGALSLLAGVAGYFLAARALSAIDAITAAARRISAEDLSARLRLPDQGDEVSRLANTFDEMLARIENGFARQRQFTADASHELRTPLAAMRAILDYTRSGERPPAEYRQALDDLSGEVDYLQRLAESLLTMARAEGEQRIQKVELDLAQLLGDVVESLRWTAEAKGLRLAAELPPPLSIQGDADALIRLAVNLVDNAVRYTERGEVRLSARAQGDWALIEVSDTGAGIPPEHLPHLFERFYRAEAARSPGGAGLGLAIADQIARAHGGRIEVDSALGVGTTFLVYLPR